MEVMAGFRSGEARWGPAGCRISRFERSAGAIRKPSHGKRRVNGPWLDRLPSGSRAVRIAVGASLFGFLSYLVVIYSNPKVKSPK
jgi:hypothetical protein